MDPTSDTESYSSVTQLSRNNTQEDFNQASDLLIRVARNILSTPRDVKYRRIRIGNPLVITKLLPVSGAMECLFEMGFEEDGEYLTLPLNASLESLKKVNDQLVKERGTSASMQSSQSTQDCGASSVVTPVSDNASLSSSVPNSTRTSSDKTAEESKSSEVATRNVPSLPASPNIFVSEMQFFGKLQTNAQHVLLYENPQLQQKAREIIPMAELDREADVRLNSSKSNKTNKIKNVTIDKRDCLLLALLTWFKTSFFSWVNSPECTMCRGPTTNTGMVPPASEERKWLASRVENYHCDKCQTDTRFPRYNDPGKLLDTRCGRCGEWANCFTLCCRALGFEARYVLDLTDHVWTEVFSVSQDRWMHCDPCENVCDKPLLYEAGWGKKLTYVIAFSNDDIQDVTWKYTANHSELMRRRDQCRENWLIGTILNLRKKQQSTVSETRQGTLLKRTIKELVEMLVPLSSEEQELSGRTSGSLAWRQARGELGNTTTATNTEKPTETFVFRLSESEAESKTVHVKYCCASDEYLRPSNSDAKLMGWRSGVFSAENVFRKEESDWKMVYLARDEDAACGTVVWKFDVKGSGLTIDSIKIHAGSTVYENGRVQWRICAEESCALIKDSEWQTFDNEFKGCEIVTVTATLTGGHGSVAWQHAQLFRQTTSDTTEFPFEMIISLQHNA